MLIKGDNLFTVHVTSASIEGATTAREGGDVAGQLKAFAVNGCCKILRGWAREKKIERKNRGMNRKKKRKRGREKKKARKIELAQEIGGETIWQLRPDHKAEKHKWRKRERERIEEKDRERTNVL